MKLKLKLKAQTDTLEITTTLELALRESIRTEIREELKNEIVGWITFWKQPPPRQGQSTLMQGATLMLTGRTWELDLPSQIAKNFAKRIAHLAQRRRALAIPKCDKLTTIEVPEEDIPEALKEEMEKLVGGAVLNRMRAEFESRKWVILETVLADTLVQPARFFIDFLIDLVYPPARADEVIVLLEGSLPSRIRRYGAVLAQIWYCIHGLNALCNRAIELADHLIERIVKTLADVAKIIGNLRTTVVFLVVLTSAYTASDLATKMRKIMELILSMLG